MKQLLIFGDSIMRGVYYSAEHGRHKLYRERFASLKDKGYEITNCSVMGATIETGMDLVRKRITSPASDTTVIFEYGGNDCDYAWSEISDNPSGEFLPKTPLEQFKTLYSDCIDYVKSLGARVQICNLVPLNAERYMKWISKNLSTSNILSWLGDESMLYRWHEYYNRAAEQLAFSSSCPLIDIRSPFLLSHNYANLLSDDGIHPSVEGHRVIDALIAESIA